MSVYVYSEFQVERMVASSKRFRVGFCLVASAILAFTILLAIYRPTYRAFHEPFRGWLNAMIGALLLPVVTSVWKWNRWPRELRSSLSQVSVDICESSVSVVYGSLAAKRQICRSELLRVEEPALGGGLYLRTPNRYRWTMIPCTLDGYESVKLELKQMGRPVVRTSIPPNLEEYVGVLLFFGTTICAFSVHAVQLLTLNLFVAILLSLGGLFVIRANPDAKTMVQLRWAKYGVFLPVIFAAIGLWLALHPY